MIGIDAVEAPWGPVHVAADAEGVVALEVLTTPDAFAGSVRRRHPGRTVADGRADPIEPAAWGRLAAAVEAIEAFLDGRPDALATLPYGLHGLSAWDRLVLDGVRTVPWGEVTSYGRLARRIGRPRAARAVGGAVGRNPIGLLVPCHRVIAGDGSIGGYGGSWLGDRDALLTIKRRLLALEGDEPGMGPVTWTTFGGQHG
jgi:methylated-DNA-[protein]-cysteine S-methyltransferase